MSKWFLLAAISFIMAGCASNGEMACCADPSMTGKVRHVVLFQWKDSATPQQIDAVVKAFGAEARQDGFDVQGHSDLQFVSKLIT